LTSVLIAASVGVPAIIVLSSTFGAAGGAWGLGIGELSSVTAQAISVCLLWRRTRSFRVSPHLLARSASSETTDSKST